MKLFLQYFIYIEIMNILFPQSKMMRTVLVCSLVLAFLLSTVHSAVVR